MTLRAHALAMELTDIERVALGAALIQTVLRTDRAAHVLMAARHVREHGEALQNSDISGVACLDTPLLQLETSDGSDTGQPTRGAIEQNGPSDIPGEVTPGDPGRSFSSSLGAAWARFIAAEARFSDSWGGDFVSAVCAALIAIFLLVGWPLFVPEGWQ
ncbi:hypothetical protein [Sagittula salina]|uniref:Uncharacterized protein n=1 Tax=Sagittula salina TaxID=2820268 RepID=A0A940MQG4_9RHOB|nr:hypothetical protein [Sagittula salina]MBP0483973.1 hypothetical protein [Sagittula salina]